MNIYPSILTDSMSELQQQLDYSEASSAEVAQIDIVDGFFADNITVAPRDLAVAEFGELKIDLHLMVDEPMDFVFESEGVKTHLPIRAIIAQVEHMSYQASFIEEVKKQNWKAGLSLDIATSLDAIDESWKSVDIIQLMSIEAGFQGQKFIPHVLGHQPLFRGKGHRSGQHDPDRLHASPAQPNRQEPRRLPGSHDREPER